MEKQVGPKTSKSNYVVTYIYILMPTFLVSMSHTVSLAPALELLVHKIVRVATFSVLRKMMIRDVKETRSRLVSGSVLSSARAMCGGITSLHTRKVCPRAGPRDTNSASACHSHHTPTSTFLRRTFAVSSRNMARSHAHLNEV